MSRCTDNGGVPDVPAGQLAAGTAATPLKRLCHALAVAIEPLRRPGRFSVFNYSRAPALARAVTCTGRVLDVGAGRRRIAPHVTTVDIAPGPCVDVVADAEALPFEDGSCEGVWLEAVLEHVARPDVALREARRVLKEGGWLYCEVPFLQGEHAAPSDYRRWTRQGLRQLFDDWEIEWLEPASGPFSALAYQLRVCLAALTACGSNRLYGLLFGTLWAYVVWPVKFLDVFVRRNAFASAHAFGWALMARKPARKAAGATAGEGGR